ncbi:MAG: UDP-2,3-diacylglucosamine diphosphatase [Gammaproteobacteria bacterium]|nr:MAG: UDP-2,3-diacylglucosamine diphosphatase [Gammaproteobacteria bacterium]
MSETLFISDLHLDADRPQITEGFHALLAGRARQARALYILGDLFEYWIGDDDPQDRHAPTLEAIAALVEHGVPVFFLPGNRDFLLGERALARSRMQLLPDEVVVDVEGTPTLLMHGDLLCTDDVDYQAMRRQFRDPAWQRAFLALPWPEREAQVRALRARSREATYDKPQDITDVNPQAVVAALRKHGVTDLVHGHTHRPAIHELEVDGQPARRMVLGDWYREGSLLICSGPERVLERLPL